MIPKPKVGEVWWADLGMIAKTRPAVIMYYPSQDDARSLMTLAPLTSQILGGPWEVPISKPFWLPKKSVVDVQGLVSWDKNALTRKMGTLSGSELKAVRDVLKTFLQL